MEANSPRLGVSEPDPATEGIPGRGGPPDLALQLAEVPGDSSPVFSAAVTNQDDASTQTERPARVHRGVQVECDSTDSE